MAGIAITLAGKNHFVCIAFHDMLGLEDHTVRCSDTQGWQQGHIHI
jgi:hypothetical protein